MEKIIRTVYTPCEREKIIEKSRFITYSTHVESEEEARAFLYLFFNHTQPLCRQIVCGMALKFK